MIPIERLIFAASCWFCALVIIAIAIWAYKRRDPMHFWSGTTVLPEEIADIPAYNRANGRMWLAYAAGILLAGVVSLFSIAAGAALLVAAAVLGLFILIAVYNRILNRYKSDAEVPPGNRPSRKVPKPVVAGTAMMLVIIHVFVGGILYFGEREPVVHITSYMIRIDGMYKMKISTLGITDVSLLENRMSDLDIGTRTNGYAGFGQARKGNFQSESLGEILLFVQAKSAPTIRIERDGARDVYISFKDSKATERLYHEILQAVPVQ